MKTRYTPFASAYDFDGTLAPGNMQEHQFIPDVGMSARRFWARVDALAREQDADAILAYMQVMLEQASVRRVMVRREDFKRRGASVVLFDGVRTWFDRIDAHARKRQVKVMHYIVSSGNAEIIAGTPIADRFEQIYASRFMYDHHGVAFWPAQAINYTTKTQFLFRINKGVHDLHDDRSVNAFIAPQDRAIPFENMVFIGDGLTDIPCFRLVKEQGGLSVAVYRPNTRGARAKAARLIDEGRVHCAVPANYRAGGEVERTIKARIDEVAARAVLRAQLRGGASGSRIATG